MDSGRRKLLKAAGLTAVGVGAGAPLLTALAAGTSGHTSAGPVPGARWGMVIDTRKCKAKDGCKDCRIACHQGHNVPDIPDPKHEIKWIWNEPYRDVFPAEENEYMDPAFTHRALPVLCNHCENPPCTRVCPTQATWQRKDGVVMMDWHRCIGCRYCAVACPYGARSFNWMDPRPYIKKLNPAFPSRAKGFIEKCTFCEERLEVGKLPLCVEACKQKCLVFGDLNQPDSEIRAILRSTPTIRRRAHLGTGPKVFYIV
jgi:Fe-S-cluster-containing dehydrogenase component